MAQIEEWQYADHVAIHFRMFKGYDTLKELSTSTKF